MRRRLCSAAVLAAALAMGASPGDDSRAERFELANGLDVILRPIQGGGPVALLTLYDIGEDHDPEGRSGLAHLVEHLYVTSAAGERASTTAEEWMARYGSQVNAQTGRRYTVFATVFEVAKLDEELRDAAARMSALNVEAEDVAREVPRLRAELDNMYSLMPALAAQNLAAEAASPAAEGGRKGGVMEQIAAATLQEIRERLGSLYKPCNARLVLAGGFDSAAVRTSIEALFGPIPRGEPVPAPRATAAPRAGLTESITVPRPESGKVPGTLAAVAWRVPEPGSPDYPAFLVMFGRLFRNVDVEAEPPIWPVDYKPLDRPDVMVLGAEVAASEAPEDTVAFLRGQAAAAAAPAKGETVSAGWFIEPFGGFMGFADFADFQIAAYPYSVAFMLGRRAQLGIDPPRLLEELARVTADDLRRLSENWFAPGKGAAVVVKIGGGGEATP